MSGDRILVEELLKQGADQGVKAKKKDVQEGAELTPKELAEATGFRHMKVFMKADESKRVDQKNENDKRKKAEHHNLGRIALPTKTSELDDCKIDSIKVRVTRQDTGLHEGNMMEEFFTFLRKYFPKFDKEHLKFPGVFSFDERTFGNVHCPLDTDNRNAGSARAEDRKKAIEARKGELTLYNTVHRDILLGSF